MFKFIFLLISLFFFFSVGLFLNDEELFYLFFGLLYNLSVEWVILGVHLFAELVELVVFNFDNVFLMGLVLVLFCLVLYSLFNR